MTGKKKNIQTEGALFEAVQSSGIFDDSKFFVDATPKRKPELIIKEWESLRLNADFDLKLFVRENFQLPGSGTEEKILESENMRDHIRKLWPHLFRESHREISPESSLIPLPHPYVVPGGRFREIYYWDSYFTSLGLAVDGHADMVLSMVKNFDFLIQEYGHIPNGNRVYYLSRSQPPFFAAMVKLVETHFGKEEIEEFLPSLVKEYSFWMDEPGNSGRRLVSVSGDFTLNRYWDDNPQPRQESWIEDVETAAVSPNEEKSAVYLDIRAAAESGWDFTSRWFSDKESLRTIETTKVLPVDLNTLLWSLESQLSLWHKDFGKDEDAEKYAVKAALRKTAMNKLMWNESQGFFFDYHIQNDCQTDVWSLVSVYPLYFGFATPSQAKSVADHLGKKFLKPGGLLTTLNSTGEQWDSPNGWAPLQWLAYQGLRNYGQDALAEKIALNWIKVNEEVFSRTGKMVEKYNVVDLSQEGGGGEYPLQDGFGWSNGVAAVLIDEIESPAGPPDL